MASSIFTPEASLLLVVDIQERLWLHIANREQVRDRSAIMIQGAHLLGVPVIVSEQYPKGLSPTIAAVNEVRPPEAGQCSKMAFGCLADPPLARMVEESARRQLVICGIETHVCVLQTALDALQRGFTVGVVADAVGSRDEANRQFGLARMRDAGAVILTSEMILFEWMRTAQHPAFKSVSALVK